MGNVGKISSLKKEYDRNNGSFEAALSNAGWSRFPMTGVRLEPYKRPNGSFETGLDENAPYITRMRKEDAEIEKKRVIGLRETLEALTGLDLGSRSKYYSDRHNPNQRDIRAGFYRLLEGDNIFNFEDPFKYITYLWLKAHPMIASSYQAYERGEYPAQTQFFVNDDAIEEELLYKKKTMINNAISILNSMSIPKRQKVARLLGLPITDNTKEMLVYNLLDSYIKQMEVSEGEAKGANSIEIFNKFATMDEKILHVRDLVGQAIKHTIYRTKNGRITEGGVEIAKSKEDLIEFLMLDKNQDEKIALEDKLNSKKSVA